MFAMVEIAIGDIGWESCVVFAVFGAVMVMDLLISFSPGGCW